MSIYDEMSSNPFIGMSGAYTKDGEHRRVINGVHYRKATEEEIKNHAEGIQAVYETVFDSERVKEIEERTGKKVFNMALGMVRKYVYYIPNKAPVMCVELAGC